ncbi:hypothetical protein V6Z12_A07G105700 [Gossypium hirsutum]
MGKFGTSRTKWWWQRRRSFQLVKAGVYDVLL